MNSRTLTGALWPSLWREDRWRGHLLIGVVFVLLLASLVTSLQRYWSNSLQPRLYASAQTQAQIVAQAQAAVIVKTITHGQVSEIKDNLFHVVQEILLVTDPAIGERMVLGVTLLIDYDEVPVATGSLDLTEGNLSCETCFTIVAPLIDQAGILMGVAEFSISDGYFTILSDEMKSKLYAESSIALALLLLVWLTMMFMFDRLHRAKKIIEASDQAKTRFMANVTHELRTPLNAILGYTQLYKDDLTLMAKHGQGVETIDRSAQHLLLLINDILDFSRTDQERLQLHPREVPLQTVLNTLVEITLISAKLKGVKFSHSFPAHMPTNVIMDDKRLRQVLLNLLSNAVKFTQQGEVEFKVTVVRQEAKKITMRFCVRDTGLGIAKEDLREIFIPFHQIDNSITRAEGSGLGLTISQRIVKLMGSELRVRSEPDVGSEFWFDLELYSASEQTVEVAPNTFEAKRESVLVLPSYNIMQDLLENSRQHNVLAVRKIVDELKTQKEYDKFLSEIEPFVRNYRFKQLVDWLEATVPTQKS